MILKFATKRDVNGNRKYLAIDTDKKQWSNNNASWFCRDDIVEVGKQDLIKIWYEVTGTGEYEEADNI